MSHPKPASPQTIDAALRGAANELARAGVPPEFAEQLDDARFVEDSALSSISDAEFLEDGEFFNIVGFTTEPTDDGGADASTAPTTPWFPENDLTGQFDFEGSTQRPVFTESSR